MLQETVFRILIVVEVVLVLLASAMAVWSGLHGLWIQTVITATIALSSTVGIIAIYALRRIAGIIRSRYGY